MAAILCSGCGDLCAGCGKVLCVYPCKACGVTCEACCKACNVSCEACCKAFREVICSPFFPYILVTYLLNLAPFTFGIQALSVLTTAGCSGGAQWLVVNAVFCLLHMVACLYVAHKIRKDEHDHAEQPAILATTYGSDGNKIEEGTVYHSMVTPGSGTTKYSWARIKHVLCFDKGVAVYILVAIGWMVWQVMGFGKFVAMQGSGCSMNLSALLITSLMCGWAYISLVGLAFLCSMCCMKL